MWSLSDLFLTTVKLSYQSATINRRNVTRELFQTLELYGTIRNICHSKRLNLQIFYPHLKKEIKAGQFTQHQIWNPQYNVVNVPLTVIYEFCGRKWWSEIRLWIWLKLILLLFGALLALFKTDMSQSITDIYLSVVFS